MVTSFFLFFLKREREIQLLADSEMSRSVQYLRDWLAHRKESQFYLTASQGFVASCLKM